MALFKTTDELKKYIIIDANLNFNKFLPSVEMAEIEFIKPLLGDGLYSDLHTAYNTDDELSTDLKVLLPYVQRCLANYAALLATEELGVSVGDAGIQQQFDQHSQPAPAWKVKDLKLKYLKQGDKAADILLEFLEFASIIPDGQGEAQRVYKRWYDSEANTALSGCIVYKTAIANKYIDILSSRRLFLRLKKRIKEIEGSVIKRLICSDQYAALINALSPGGTVSNVNKELISLLEPIICKRALYETLPMLPVIITADGLFLQSSNDSVVQKMQASSTDRATLMQQLKEGEDTGYLADERRLQDFLNANIADYPLIKNSACWSGTSTSTDERWKVDNDPCNKHFSV